MIDRSPPEIDPDLEQPAKHTRTHLQLARPEDGEEEEEIYLEDEEWPEGEAGPVVIWCTVSCPLAPPRRTAGRVARRCYCRVPRGAEPARRAGRFVIPRVRRDSA